MTESRIALTFAFRVASRVFSSSTAVLAAAAAFVPATWEPWGLTNQHGGKTEAERGP